MWEVALFASFMARCGWGGRGEEITRKLPTNENDRASIGPQPLAYLGPFTVLPLPSSTSCLLTYTLLLPSDKLLQSAVYHLWSKHTILVLAHFAPKPASWLSCYDLGSADNTWRLRAFELRTNFQHLLQSNFEACCKLRYNCGLQLEANECNRR